MSDYAFFGKFYLRLAVFVLAGLAPALHSAFAYSSGPPDGVAGDPPDEANCTMCHSTYPLNYGQGTLQIANLPDVYRPDSVYTLTVTLENPGQRIWGFEMTALSADQSRAGWLAPLDGNVQVSSPTAPDRDYAKHTSQGNQSGQASASWQVQWTAPPAESGIVYFYLTGNTGNGNLSSSGDYIYTIMHALPEEVLGIADPVVKPPESATLLNAYPNPFNPELTLYLSGLPAGAARLQIWDLQGRLVETIQFDVGGNGAFALPLDLRDEPSGSYFLQLRHGDGIIVKTVTKMK